MRCVGKDRSMKVLRGIMIATAVVGCVVVVGSVGTVDYLVEIGSNESVTKYFVQMIVGVVLLGVGVRGTQGCNRWMRRRSRR